MRSTRLAVLFMVSSCATSEKVDVVNDVPPVSTAFASIRGDLATMAGMSRDQRAAYIREHWPHLTEGVVYFLRQRGKIAASAQVSRVEFFYGSLKNVRAENADGQARGYFENQLVAAVHVRGTQKPIHVIVQCLNGMFALPEDLTRLQALGMSSVPVERFTIGRGEGLVHHVDFPVAIDLAARFNLPLYRGRTVDEGRRITPEVARTMEPGTDRVQVTVLVHEGDTFDLDSGTFTPAPSR